LIEQILTRLGVSAELQESRDLDRARERRTDWGMDFEPIIIQLGRWGARSPSMPRNAELGVDSLVLSLRTLRTMFDTQAAEGLEALSTSCASAKSASGPRSQTAASRSLAGKLIDPRGSSRPIQPR
jgi:hypothetical protein